MGTRDSRAGRAKEMAAALVFGVSTRTSLLSRCLLEYRYYFLLVATWCANTWAQAVSLLWLQQCFV
jgi:hypothetical protein